MPARWTQRPNDERQFKLFQDIRALLSDDLSQPIYSEEIARKLGLSVRTLHDVVRRYRGMSLHRYLRLRRLWLVRQRLLAGADSVKAVALAFGFWHLSAISPAAIATSSARRRRKRWSSDDNGSAANRLRPYRVSC